MDKTTETFEALRELAKLNPYSKIPLKLIIHKAEIVGFTFIKDAGIELDFRATGNKKDKVEDAI